MWVGFQIAFSNGFPDKWLESKWLCMEEVSKYLFQKLPKGAYLWGILEHCSWHQLQRDRDSENWHKNGNQRTYGQYDSVSTISNIEWYILNFKILFKSSLQL